MQPTSTQYYRPHARVHTPAVPYSPQVDYVLGDCGRSWMVGFGEKYPQVGWGGRLLCLHTLLSGPSRTGWRNGGSSSAALHGWQWGGSGVVQGKNPQM